MTDAALNTRAGRMLDAMLTHGNRNAAVRVTVSLFQTREGREERRLHQTFRFKAYESQHGANAGSQMVACDLMDGDWGAGIYSTKVMQINITRSEIKPGWNEGAPYADALMLYAAKAAWSFLADGTVPEAANGRVEVAEEAFCGCCGRELTHPDSIAIGIGPECEKKLGGDAARYGITIKARSRKRAKAQGSGKGAATAAPTCAAQNATADRDDVDIFGAPVDEAERRMQEMEARGDREGTIRDEIAKHEARRVMETRA
jgi:hypothetical protein